METKNEKTIVLEPWMVALILTGIAVGGYYIGWHSGLAKLKVTKAALKEIGELQYWHGLTEGLYFHAENFPAWFNDPILVAPDTKDIKIVGEAAKKAAEFIKEHLIEEEFLYRFK